MPRKRRSLTSSVALKQVALELSAISEKLDVLIEYWTPQETELIGFQAEYFPEESEYYDDPHFPERPPTERKR